MPSFNTRAASTLITFGGQNSRLQTRGTMFPYCAVARRNNLLREPDCGGVDYYGLN